MRASRPLARILLVTGEPIGERLAGPAIRTWQMAEALSSAGHTVTVASTGGVDRVSTAFAGAAFTSSSAERLVDASDVIIFQGSFYASMPWLARKEQIQVMDLYDPFHIEFMQTDHGLPQEAFEDRVVELSAELNAQLGRADLVLCATDRQRDLWLGHLASLGRLRPAGVGAGAEVDALVRIVPFGTPNEPFPGGLAASTGASVIRTAARGISESDIVLLWAGGIYDWFDPLTLIRAMSVVLERSPSLKLFFLASSHPNSAVQPHERGQVAQSLAAELGLLDVNVFFNDGWVAYDERYRYLAEASGGVTTHDAGLETRFSFRTRNLDYLWAGLPIVTSEGDSFAELVRTADAGIVVPAGDVGALAAALEEFALDSERRSVWSHNSAAIGEQRRWQRALEPLIAFAADPTRATVPVRAGTGMPARRRRSVADDARTALKHLRAGGLSLLWTRLQNRRHRDALRRPRG